jgi:hypothetical protein
VEKLHGLDIMQTEGWIAKIIRDEDPAKVSIDAAASGLASMTAW